MRDAHTPVLLHEVLDLLMIHADDTIVDATLGGAGHARAIAEAQGEKGVFIGFDMDADAIQRANDQLASTKPTKHFVEGNFRYLARELERLGVTVIDKALFDLGWSAYQRSSGRGFSFMHDEPLVMTYDKGSEGLTAAEIVNEWKEGSLADIIFGWGEERYARRIARAIVDRRSRKPFASTFELADVITSAVPAAYRFGKLHPATRTFQALRITVNDELDALREGLGAAWKLLKPGGRLAVITFHSIEDRIVKQMFAAWESEGSGTRIVRKPVRPSSEEVRRNPRSRSAKLRGIEKVVLYEKART